MNIRDIAVSEDLDLIKQIKDVNEKDSLGNTYLFYAVSMNDDDIYLDTVKELLKKGANINEQNSVGYTALMEAGIHDNEAIIIELLANGADPTIKNMQGHTILQLRFLNKKLFDNHPEVLKRKQEINWQRRKKLLLWKTSINGKMPLLFNRKTFLKSLFV